MEELFMHRENSVHHQVQGNYDDFRRFVIYTFTPADVCAGIKKTLVERYGAENARRMLPNWLGLYLALSRQIPPQSKEIFIRQKMVEREIESFLRAEGHSGQIVIDI